MLAEEAEASLTAATRKADFELGEGSGSIAVGSLPFPL
jgi:hypothetical protein